MAFPLGEPSGIEAGINEALNSSLHLALSWRRDSQFCLEGSDWTGKEKQVPFIRHSPDTNMAGTHFHRISLSFSCSGEKPKTPWPVLPQSPKAVGLSMLLDRKAWSQLVGCRLAVWLFRVKHVPNSLLGPKHGTSSQGSGLFAILCLTSVSRIYADIIGSSWA